MLQSVASATEELSSSVNEIKPPGAGIGRGWATDAVGQGAPSPMTASANCRRRQAASATSVRADQHHRRPEPTCWHSTLTIEAARARRGRARPSRSWHRK